MKSQLKVIKIGGNIIENRSLLSAFLRLFSAVPDPKILVHGGGKKASEVSTQLGITPTMVGGRRITDSKSLEVVVMVYAGLVNKTLVAELQALDCNAIGLSGADGDIIRAHRRPVKDIDYGFAGDVDSVNSGVLLKILQAGMTPVCCALTHDKKGQLLNTNADTIAAELAIGMSSEFEVTLYYCFEKKGVLKDHKDDRSVIRHIDRKRYQELVQTNVITEGMLPKLHNCFQALNGGVGTVHIGDLEMLKTGSLEFTTIAL